jgi:hypothetical protein
LKYTVFLLFLVAASNIKGQAGANFIALGANSANPDAGFSLANNPALFDNHKLETGCWGLNRFAATKMVHGGLAAHYLFRNSAIGISANYRGTALWNTTEVHVNFGQRITENFSMGFAIGHSRIFQAEGYTGVGRIFGKIGLHAKAGKKVTASLVLSNPWVVNDPWQKSYPRADFAIGYPFGKQTRICAQFHNQPEGPAVYGLSLVHNVKEKLAFRVATQSGYEPLSAGVELQQKNLRFSMATSYHTYLGFSPSFALVWQKK